MSVHLNIPNVESYPNVTNYQRYEHYQTLRTLQTLPITNVTKRYKRYQLPTLPVANYLPPGKSLLGPIAQAEPIRSNPCEGVFNQDYTGPSLGIKHLTMYMQKQFG
jgi:hypothetical protein